MDSEIWNRSRLDLMARGRGLHLDRLNPTDDLLLPPSGSPEEYQTYINLLDHYGARLLIRELINTRTSWDWEKGRRSVERFCDTGTLDGYLDTLRTLAIVVGPASSIKPALSKNISSFGATYEWYVSSVLAREFTPVTAWGACFSGMESGGDHDVIADLHGRFLYMEVKTGPPKHIEQAEVSGFIRRLIDLAPDIAIFHDDTHLRMKDKVVPLMEEGIRQLKGESGKGKGINGSHEGLFQRLEREIFHLDGAIYIVNSKPDLRRNLDVVFRHHFRCDSKVLGVLS